MKSLRTFTPIFAIPLAVACVGDTSDSTASDAAPDAAPIADAAPTETSVDDASPPDASAGDATAEEASCEGTAEQIKIAKNTVFRLRACEVPTVGEVTVWQDPVSGTKAVGKAFLQKIPGQPPSMNFRSETDVLAVGAATTSLGVLGGDYCALVVADFPPLYYQSNANDGDLDNSLGAYILRKDTSRAAERVGFQLAGHFVADYQSGGPDGVGVRLGPTTFVQKTQVSGGKHLFDIRIRPGMTGTELRFALDGTPVPPKPVPNDIDRVTADTPLSIGGRQGLRSFYRGSVYEIHFLGGSEDAPCDALATKLKEMYRL